jgi:oxygen-dependent protoporphyrinogen oxidase
MSAILSNRAPKGGALCSVFVGGVRREDLTVKTDDEIREIVGREFSSAMKLKEFNPDLFRIIRYRNAIPQYGKESREKMDAIEMLESRYKGLLLGGNFRDGIGMADRIKQGKHLADLV